MPYTVPMNEAQIAFPEYTFIKPLTPSEQKAAFHVKSNSGQDLCFKIIAPNYSLDRLEREIQALQSISHNNVVGLVEYTFSSKQGGQQRHYIVEQFVEGHDLAQDLQAGSAWSLADTTAFFAQLFDGLHAMHTLKIVHRDLKPTNIRVDTNGDPVIIDFGLARHLDLPDITKTSEGAALGTPMYFSPEQFIGTKRDIDNRTDLFAAGIILHQAVTGRHPFWRTGMTISKLHDAVCTSHSHLEAAEYKSLPKAWQVLLGRLLEKERAKRPQNADQVATLLRKLPTSGGI